VSPRAALPIPQVWHGHLARGRSDTPPDECLASGAVAGPQPSPKKICV